MSHYYNLLQFTFELDDPHLEIAEKLNFATKLLPILRDRAPVERVDRAENLNPDSQRETWH